MAEQLDNYYNSHCVTSSLTSTPELTFAERQTERINSHKRQIKKYT